MVLEDQKTEVEKYTQVQPYFLKIKRKKYKDDKGAVLYSKYRQKFKWKKH